MWRTHSKLKKINIKPWTDRRMDWYKTFPNIEELRINIKGFLFFCLEFNTWMTIFPGISRDKTMDIKSMKIKWKLSFESLQLLAWTKQLRFNKSTESLYSNEWESVGLRGLVVKYWVTVMKDRVQFPVFWLECLRRNTFMQLPPGCIRREIIG